MAVALAGVVALAGFSSSCRSGEASDATTSTASAPATIETAAVADVVEDGTQDRVARMAFIEGDVAIRPVEAEEWETVEVNAPVFEGYDVYAEEDARGELMLGDDKYARFGDGAELTLARLDPNFAQVELTSGTCTLALDQYADGDYYEISTPAGALVPQQAGSYRVDVLPDGRSRVVVLRGVAQITTPEGTFEASEGDVVDLGYEQAQVNVVAGGAPQYRDDFDDWSYQRETYYSSFSQYDVPEPVRVFDNRNDIYGVLALAAYGAWQALDDDDHYVWVPYDARRSGWSPYSNGYWDYGPTVGWTWISHEPWGWAPYHYGRWDYRDRVGWCWAPYYENQIVGVTAWRQQYRWHPSQVYFYQPPQRNYYAWVPLAPGEAYIPYTTAFVPRRGVQVVDFRPRFLREQRAVYYVTGDQLERRQRPRRADRVVMADLRRLGDGNVRLAKLPRPNRIVAANEVARIRPRDVARRPVVVTQKSLDRPVKPATQRALARQQRQIRRADEKPLRVQRQPVTAANVPQPGERRANRRAADPVQQPPQTVAPVDRQQRRAERQVERQQRQQRQQRPPRAVEAPQQQPRAVQPRVNAPQRQERQQQRQLQRQQRQQRRQQVQPRQQVRPRQQVQPRQQARPRAERRQTVRQQQPRAIRQQQRAVQPRQAAPAPQRRAIRQQRQATRQQQRQVQQPRATKQPKATRQGGGKRNRP